MATGFQLLTQVDNLDDRREIWLLLHRLSPRARFAFLGWACSQASLTHGAKPTPRWLTMGPVVLQAEKGDEEADRRLTTEIRMDLVCLGLQFGVDLAALAARLESVVRRRRS